MQVRTQTWERNELNTSLLKLRLSKLTASLTRPCCWRALAYGVAPAIEHLPVLRKLTVDGVVDVGANRGQFSLSCRIAMPTVPVLAFEPIPGEAKIYKSIHGMMRGVELCQCALGETSSEAEFHLSNSLDSSSLLPIGKRQRDLFPETAESGTIKVEVKTLDDFLPKMSGRSAQLLKIDVQGFELGVLKGAVKTLSTCRHVYAECSEVQLYEGQALRPAVASFLAGFGFKEFGSYNHQHDQSELIQADYLFSRA